MKTKKIITSIAVGALILTAGTADINNNVIRAKSDVSIRKNSTQTEDKIIKIVSSYIKINNGIITLENELLLKEELPIKTWGTIECKARS